MFSSGAKYFNSFNALILSLVICIIVFLIYLRNAVIPFEVSVEHSRKCKSNIEYYTLRNRLLRNLDHLDDLRAAIGVLAGLVIVLSLPSLMYDGNYITFYIIVYAILFLVLIAEYKKKDNFDQYRHFQKDLQLWIDETLQGDSIHKKSLENMIQGNMNVVEGLGVYKKGEESNYVSMVELEKIRARMIDRTKDMVDQDQNGKNSTYLEDKGKINHYRKTIPSHKQQDIYNEFYNDIYHTNGILFNIISMLFVYIVYSLLSFSQLLF